MRLARSRTVLAACTAALLPALAPAQAPDASRIERGAALFAHTCGVCHREGGTGTFILTRRLGSERALLERRTDLPPDYVRFVVRNGLVNMPRISRVELPDADLDAVIAWLSRDAAAVR